MNRIFTLFLYAFLHGELSAQTFNPLLANMLQDTLTNYVSQISNIKGMSAAVYVPGQGTWTGVAGNSHAGQPISSDMRLGIASNSKLFVSTVLLMLAEDGILSLEDPVGDWIPNYPNINPNITLRQLLNHSSGISDPIFTSPWMDTILAHPNRVFTPNEVLSWLGAPLFPAGSGYGYSNVNYIVAGMVAQSATGFHISQLIRDRILTPLDMDSTFYDVEEPENGIIAHRWWDNVDYHDTSRVGLNTAGGCAGSIFSTASEMVQWYSALFGGELLNAASMAELTTFIATGVPNGGYGLGLSKEKTQGFSYWGHGGATWGYRSKMIQDSCLGVSVCGLTNSFPSGMDAVTFLLYRVLKNHLPGCSGAISGTDSLCAGTNAVLYTVPAIAGATSYEWVLPSGAMGTSNTNSIVLDFAPNAVSGEVIVRGVNAYGPGGHATFPVTVLPKPAKPTIIQNGNTLTSSASSGNQWYDANGILVGATGQILNIAENGDYYCIVTAGDCSSEPSDVAHVVLVSASMPSPSRLFSIYPNPVQSTLFIESNDIDQPLSILSIDGIELLTSSGQKSLDVSMLPAGVYIVVMGNERRKFVK